MTDVSLPIVPDSTSPAHAIRELRIARKSALLAAKDGQHFLLSAGEIVSAQSKNVPSLAGLTEGKRPLKPAAAAGPAKKSTSFVERVSRGLSNRLEFGREEREGPLDEGSEPRDALGIKTIQDNVAVVALADQELAARYVSGPRDFYCDGPRHHDFPPPYVEAGDDCPRGDGHKIVQTP